MFAATREAVGGSLHKTNQNALEDVGMGAKPMKKLLQQLHLPLKACTML